MSDLDLLLIAAIAAATFYAGYKVGQASAPGPRDADETSPLPGPRLDETSKSAPTPPRPRGAPPSASAGEANPSAPSGSARPRTTAPPPAAAGLVDKSGAKDG